jgi:hypothetical protein
MPDTPEIPPELGEMEQPCRPDKGLFRGNDLRTSTGRRIRRLYSGYADQVGDQADLIVQAATLKVAVLQVIVERLQNELLRSKRHDRRLGEELVRHENGLRRAKAELTAMIKAPIPWWESKDGEEN